MRSHRASGPIVAALRIISLSGLIAAVAGPTSSMSFGPFELPVAVEDRPGVVRLRMHVPQGVPQSSIEVEITGRNVVVHGRDRNGLPMRSREIPLSQPVSSAYADTELSPDGALVITLHVLDEGGS